MAVESTGVTELTRLLPTRDRIFDAGAHPAIELAWRARGDWRTHDALWRAACWARSADESERRGNGVGARHAYARAHEIVRADSEAVRLVEAQYPTRIGSAPAQWLSGAPASTAVVQDWPRAKRAAWG